MLTRSQDACFCSQLLSQPHDSGGILFSFLSRMSNNFLTPSALQAVTVSLQTAYTLHVEKTN